MNDDTTTYEGDFVSLTYVAILVVGKDGVIRHHTSEAGRMLASPDEDLVGRRLPSLFQPEASGELEGLLRRVLEQPAPHQAVVEATCTLAGRGGQFIRVTAVNVAADAELAVIALCQFGDPAGIRRAYEGARRAARYDPLTGLLNRRAFDERGEALFGDGSIRPAIVAGWDVDHLKAVNDLHGRGIGDQVLQHVAKSLSTGFGSAGVVARVGGDEFAVLLFDTNPAQAKVLLEAVASALRVPLPGTNVTVTATCGAAQSTSARDWPELLMRADNAVFTTKRSNPGGVGFADPE